MATVRKLSSGKWQGRYMRDGRQRSAGAFPTRREAMQAATDAERSGTAALEANLKFRDVARRWLDYRHGDGTSGERLKDLDLLIRRLETPLGDLTIGEVSPAALDATVAALTARGLAPNTVRQTMSACNGVLEWAVRQGWIEVNPYRGVRLPKNPPPAERALEKQDVAAAVRCINPTFRPELIMLAYTGMRLGELRALHWSDVDFDRGVIVIERNYSRRLDRFKPTKGRSIRVVPMNDLVRQVLIQARNQGSYPGLPLADIPYEDVPVPDSGLVFTNRFGAPFSDTVFRREFNVAFRAAGVRGRVRIHDMRHTYAAWLAKSGVPMQDIQRLLGHTSIVTTERYSRYQIDDFGDVLKVLDADSEAVARVQALAMQDTGITLDDDGEVVTNDGEMDEDEFADLIRYGREP